MVHEGFQREHVALSLYASERVTFGKWPSCLTARLGCGLSASVGGHCSFTILLEKGNPLERLCRPAEEAKRLGWIINEEGRTTSQNQKKVGMLLLVQTLNEI